jgi:hypothetical protein
MSRAAALLTLLKQLKQADTFDSVKLHDETALRVTNPGGEVILVYLVEPDLTTAAIKRTVRHNSLTDIHTLFLVAADDLPDDGAYFPRQPVYPLDRAVRLLFDLYWGMIFTYRVDGDQVVVFPVFNAEGQAIYGEPVDTSTLSCDDVFVEAGRFTGTYRVANFGGGGSSGYSVPFFDPLEHCYRLLGITPDASLDAIKQAYREMALKHHPDTAKIPDATEKMQQINAAYDAIMKRRSV